MSHQALRFEPSELIFAVVDVQQKLAGAMEFKVREQVAGNIRRLLALAREQKSPAVVTEQYPQGLGKTLDDIVADLPENSPVLEKLAFSCWAHAPFRDAVVASGRKAVVLTGMETHICVFQTGLDLLANGFRVYVPQDACSSRTAVNWRTGLALLDKAGAVITSTETLLYQALQQAGTPAFKAMQPWLR